MTAFCATEGGSDATPFAYQDVGIDVSNGARTRSGWMIATARLPGYRCDGPLDDTAFAPQNFAVSPEGEARYLGEGLQFVDASDFGSQEAWFYVTLLTIGYMVSRGLAKSGSRDFYDDTVDSTHDGR